MTNEESGIGANRRTPRQGMGGSPVGSWLTVVLAVVAVIAGFLILREITSDSTATSSGSTAGAETSSSTPADGSGVNTIAVETIPAATTTTTIPRVVDGASVLVANANTVGGSAGNMTKTLDLAGYTMVDPVNASGANITASIVYYDAGVAAAEAVAQSVARDLGGVDVLTLPSPAPTESGDLGDAAVLVLLGDDQAGKTLEELAPATATATATGTATAPDPSDGSVPADASTDTTATSEG